MEEVAGIEREGTHDDDARQRGGREREAPQRRELRTFSARNVLVAVDGTPEAWDAVGMAVQIVQQSRGRLTLLTVVVPAPAWTQVGLFATPADDGAERMAEAWLRELTDAIPPDVPVTTLLLHGDAAHLIARRADEGNHDLVVLAAHEHGPIAAAIESVQRRLLRCSHVPVLSIHRPLTPEEKAAERAERERLQRELREAAPREPGAPREG